MTSYRAVCPFCTTHIRSGPIPEVETLDGWEARAAEWLKNHFCGYGRLDGIEKPSVFAEYEFSATVKSIKRHERILFLRSWRKEE